MGITERNIHKKLMGTTAMARALRFRFERALSQFELTELALTGEVVRENPLPYVH